MDDFDLSKIGGQGSHGIDALFKREPNLVKPVGSRRKVASIGDLASFIRLSSDTLVHRADRDLWSIRRQPDGGMYVERMFDDNGSPLKG